MLGKLIKIEPVRFDPYLRGKGIVRLTYEKRYGFLWLKKKTCVQYACSTTGVLWNWANNYNANLHDYTYIIEQYKQELADGQTVVLKGEQVLRSNLLDGIL